MKLQTRIGPTKLSTSVHIGLRKWKDWRHFKSDVIMVSSKPQWSDPFSDCKEELKPFFANQFSKCYCVNVSKNSRDHLAEDQEAQKPSGERKALMTAVSVVVWCLITPPVNHLTDKEVAWQNTSSWSYLVFFQGLLAFCIGNPNASKRTTHQSASCAFEWQWLCYQCITSYGMIKKACIVI